MARTDIDIDEEACSAVMRRFGLTTKGEAVNLALRLLAEEVRAGRGIGWEGDLGVLRGDLADPSPDLCG